MNKKIGVIGTITGRAEIVRLDGTRHEARVGDPVYEGDRLVVASGDSVSLDDGNSCIDIKQSTLLDSSVVTNTITAQDAALHSTTADMVIDALDRGTLEAPAAGLLAAEGDGNSFVMLSRILEQVNGNTYEYGFDTVQPETNVATSIYSEQATGEQATETPQQPDAQVPTTPVEQRDTTTPSTPTVPPTVEDPKLPEDHEDPTQPDEDDGDPQVPDVPVDPGTGEPDPDEGGEDEDQPVVPDVPPTPPVEPPLPPVTPPDTNPGNSGQNNGWGNGDQTAPGESGPVNNAENNTSGKTNPSNSPASGSLNINDLLSDGKHDVVYVDNGGKTTIHIEDTTTHEKIDVAFNSHVDHTIQAIMNELAKNNGVH